jgi:MFS transporter, ACS family, glucarate transporter
MASNPRRTLLWFAFTLAIVTYLDRICISAAAPFIMRDLNLSMLQMSFVFGAFTLAYSIFEVPSGWMGDVFGARRVLTRIVLWWSAFTVFTGLARGYQSLLTIRFIFGAGEAGAFPNVSRAFSRWLPVSSRGNANGILFLGSRLGGALAPMVTVFLIRRWGWRESFYFLGVLGVAWAFCWYRWFRDDPPGGVAAGAPPPGPHSGTVPWRTILGSRNLYTICAMYFTFGYGLYFYFTWLPTYLVRELGFSVSTGGVLAGLPFLMAGAANVIGGRVSDRLAVTRGLRVARSRLGFFSFATSAFLLVAAIHTPWRGAKVLLLAFALASADFALSACWSVCLDVGRNYAGIVTGFMNTFANLGGFLGPVVAGFAVERWNSWAIPFYIAAGLYGAGAAAWLGVDPEKRIDLVPSASKALAGLPPGPRDRLPREN